jgi:hypothetical protein
MRVMQTMSKSSDKPWYADRRLVAEKVDHWISRRRPHGDIGKETDWLGWDAWVRTDAPAKRLPR